MYIFMGWQNDLAVLLPNWGVGLPPIAVPSYKISKIQRLSDNLLDEYFKTRSETLIKLLNQLLKSMFPEYGSSVLEDDCISIQDGHLTINPTPINVKSIGGIIQVPGWNVVKYHQAISFDRDMPPDVIEENKGNARNDVEVCRIVCNVLFQDKLEAKLENMFLSAA